MKFLLAFSLSLASASSESQPHYHQGKLTKYKLEPPSLLLSASDEKKLRSGKAIMQAMETADLGSRRMLMVQDIPAPASVVMGRVMDLEQYPRMVSGVVACANYDSSTTGNVQKILSEYDIKALHLRFKYYMEHQYDPAQQCMTFNLDYSRRSDIDDSVGYWFVQTRGRASSRVFYSCECKLRGWVPGPVYSLLTKEALKKATTWVAEESVKEWRNSQQNNPMVRFVDDVRDSMRNLNLKLPQPTIHVGSWLKERTRKAVHSVSNAQPSHKGRPF